MNDTARWSHEPCPCGRTYPVIENIGGRLADQLYDLDGRAVNGTVIGFAFDGMRHIEKAQVVQTDRGSLAHSHRARPPDTRMQTANACSTNSRREVSARVTARIELVDDIPSLPNGKYKWVVREYDRDAGRPACPRRQAARCDAATSCGRPC